MDPPAAPSGAGAVAHRRAALAMAIVTTVAFVAYALWALAGLGRGPLDTLFNDWIYTSLVIVAGVACLWRAAVESHERAAWTAFGAALACNAVAETLYTVVVSHMSPEPAPSISDVFFLAYYPCAFTGLLLLARARGLGAHATIWLDGLVAALAATSLATWLGFGAVLRSADGDGVSLVVNTAYPALDLVLLGMIVAVLALTGRRPGASWSLLVAALLAVVVADGAYLTQSSAGTYVGGGWVDVLWPLSALLTAAAAWARPPSRPAPPTTAWLLGLPFASGLAALAILVATRTSAVATALAAATLVAVLVRVAATVAENRRMLAASEREARTDALTGLWNRRKLQDDLAAGLEAGQPVEPRILILFDLDGFKDYNDIFGHPAGDALLERLGRRLDAAVGASGAAYRMGGDEFCALLPRPHGPIGPTVDRTAAALRLAGDGFAIGSSHGSVLLPEEAADPTAALQLADERMYERKGTGRASARRQARDVLLGVLTERTPELTEHLEGVARLAVAVGRRLELLPEQLDEVARAAELHDVGKMAVPDDILLKPGPLDPREWAFIRQHTAVGERILSAAPALRPIATLVRSSHERWDGTGYPDGLAGTAIPLGARIVAVCDAYDAMVSDRAYRPALPRSEALLELQACAGTQFDPAVVDVFLEVLAGGAAELEAVDLRTPGAA